MYFVDINSILKYNIVSGAKFEWNCWPNGRYIDYVFGDIQASVVVDSESGEIYEATAYESESDNPSRWLNPEYSEAYLAESNSKGVNPSIAWDHIIWNDFADSDEFLGELLTMIEKQKKSMRKTETIQVNLTQDEFNQLALAAHNNNMTFNEYVNTILEDYIDRNGN